MRVKSKVRRVTPASCLKPPTTTTPNEIRNKLKMSSSKQTKKESRPAGNMQSKYKTQKKPSANKGDGRKNNNTLESEILENNTRIDVCNSGCVTDLSSPGLCSALQLANEIRAASVGTSKVEELKLFQQKQLDEAIKQKAMKKANIPFTKHIFKDLVDLQISDEDIPLNKIHQKNVNFHTNKDPEFRLEDFYKPDFSTEVSVKVPDQKFEVEKIDHYNGFELYERLESLKNLAKR